MKRWLLLFALCAPALAQTQLFLTTQVPTEAGNYQPCVDTNRGVHSVRGAGVTTSVTNSASGGTDIATTATAGGSELCFVSDPVLSTTTVNGTVTFNIWGFESAAQCNCAFRVKLLDYNGSTETSIVDSSMSAELGTSNVANNWTATITSYSMAAGHRFVIRTRITNAGTMGNGRSVTMNYAGTTAAASGDSFVTLPTTVPLTRTRTVKSAGGDYASLGAWEAGEQGDLTTLQEVRQAELYAFQDTTRVTVDGWTTSSTFFIRIYTDPSARHAGVYDTSKYRLETAGAGIIVNVGNIKIEGLQIKVTIASGTLNDGIEFESTIPTGGVVYADNNIIVGVLTGTATGAGIQFAGSATNTFTGNAWNNVLYGWVNGATAGIIGIFSSTGWTTNAYNNTVVSSLDGYQRSAGTFVSINNAAMSCTDGFVGTFDATSDFNASDIAADAPGTHSKNGSAATFVNAAANNYQPASTDTVLKGNGTTDPGSGLFSNDIAGTSRTAPWDIGAFVAQPTPANSTPTQMMMGVGN